MPTLVVHTSQLQDARDLVRRIGAHAEIIAFDGREKEPRAADEPLLTGADVAFVGVRKNYRRAAERLGCITRLKVATVRGASAVLEDWLLPHVPEPAQVLVPRAAFETGAGEERRLMLADGALDTADLLVPNLHPFINNAVTALRDLAAAEAHAPQGLERFFAERGVKFASSGGCAFRYRVVDRNGQEVKPLTRELHWHLKQGDVKKTPQECARIYFHTFDAAVIVARCGPHPDSDFVVTVRPR